MNSCPPRVAQPLNYTWPIMLVILSIPILKQRPRRIDALFTGTLFYGNTADQQRGTVLRLPGHFSPTGILLAPFQFHPVGFLLDNEQQNWREIPRSGCSSPSRWQYRSFFLSGRPEWQQPPSGTLKRFSLQPMWGFLKWG